MLHKYAYIFLNNARFFGILEQIGLKIYIEEEISSAPD